MLELHSWAALFKDLMCLNVWPSIGHLITSQKKKLALIVNLSIYDELYNEIKVSSIG